MANRHTRSGGLLCGLISWSFKQHHRESQTFVGLLMPTHIILCGTNIQD